jgi:hypothetical protein
MTMFLVASIPPDFDLSKHKVFYSTKLFDEPRLNAEIRKIIVCKSKKEKDEKRRAYRRDYMKRPHVQEKVKKRMSDPEVIMKRKHYADREDVKERKRILAAKARKIKNLLKEKNPELYKTCLEEISDPNDD